MADWIGALRRVLDYAKDPNPDHWRTINGSKVHLDENGNYDGGADGRFNGKHHYGPGWKEQQNKPKRRPASEIILKLHMPDLQKMTTEKLKDRMKKATNWGDWNRARGEIHRRLSERVDAQRRKFNNAYGKPEQKAIGEELDKYKDELEAFRKASSIPQKFMEEAFKHCPKRWEKAYREKKFWSDELYPAYEKWIAKRNRTTSVLKNLANSFKVDSSEDLSKKYPNGILVHAKGFGSPIHVEQSRYNPNSILVFGEPYSVPGGLKAFIEIVRAQGKEVEAYKPNDIIW